MQTDLHLTRNKVLDAYEGLSDATELEFDAYERKVDAYTYRFDAKRFELTQAKD